MLSMKHSHRKFSHFVKRRNKTYLTFNIKLYVFTHIYMFIHIWPNTYHNVDISDTLSFFLSNFYAEYIYFRYKEKKVLHSSGKEA